MIAVEALLREVRGLDAAELDQWIAASWVKPERVAGGYVFHEIDVARVHLIVELRHELMVDADAMPMILNLLDQVYALRNQLRRIADAVATLPPEVQALLRTKLDR